MRQFYKHFMALALLLMLQASAAFAVNVTYVLKRHTNVPDQYKTITATANNLSANASLQDNMPQTLWRAYTTYTYYSDEAMTQPITSVQDGVTTVYVDYYFDPPFILSDDTNVRWHHFSMFNKGGTKRYWLFYNGYGHQADLLSDFGMKNTASVGSMNAKYAQNQNWAFYGDGYDLRIKFNDEKNDTQGRNWLVCPQTSGNSANIQKPTSEPQIGWQVYGNEIGSGYCTLGSPYNSAYVMDLSNLSFYPRIIKLGTGDAKDFYLDNHNVLRTSYSGSRGDLWWHALFATPVGGGATERWHTTYKILLSDGTWYPDIVVAKRTGEPSTLQLSFPSYTKFPRQESRNYAYEYFFIDATFTTKFESTTLTNDGNTIAYIREIEVPTEELVSGKWITLVLPYDIPDTENTFEFGADKNAVVKVLEYYDVENAKGTYYTLKFRETTKIEANKPYLFKPVSVPEGSVMALQKEEAPVEQNAIDNAVGFVGEASNAKVWMTGTYEGRELTVQASDSDPLYFYFGYDERYDSNSTAYVGDEAAAGKYPYNFYRVTKKNVTMPKHRCYFHIEGAPAGAKLMLMDNFGEVITGIDGVEAGDLVRTTGRIYNLNGQVVGNDLEALPRGVYIVNGKKVMK